MNSTWMRTATLCVALGLVISLTTPAAAGLTTLRGWRLDGTGLLSRGSDGQLEPAPWAWSEWETWDVAGAAAGYEDQITDLDARSETAAHDETAGTETPEWAWEDRGSHGDDRYDAWREGGLDTRDEDRYHAYADGAEF